jgi:uncharacterized small protein (DUF1192 family)
MNYGNSLAEAQCAKVAGAISIGSRNTTVAENIDNRIASLQEQIERLETVKAKLSKGTILDVSLDDLAMAMGRY